MTGLVVIGFVVSFVLGLNAWRLKGRNATLDTVLEKLGGGH